MMAKYTRNGVQAVILVSFVLVVCFACLGCTNGESINGKRSNGMIEVSQVVRPPCYKDHHQPPELQYCCHTDKICWIDLGECFTNCPCKINCPLPPATQ
ncbi:hypothetical protein ZWY2020_026081 [Hordeum vulgare]|nr:hypothetical protein ZWY2020_026081 [Hordeum vulgare]